MKKILFAAFCLGVLLSYFLAFKAGEAGVPVSFGGPAGATGRDLTSGGWNGYREGLRYSWQALPFSAEWEPPGHKVQAAPGTAAVKPAPRLKKKARPQNAVKPAVAPQAAAEALKEPGHKRKKRISKLGEPGEALGGTARRNK